MSTALAQPSQKQKMSPILSLSSQLQHSPVALELNMNADGWEQFHNRAVQRAETSRAV
jgi:hypothetical protein